MHFLKLAKELPKYFSTQDVQNVLHIQKESARVLCTRYTKKGLFLRLKRDLYIFKEVFLHLSIEDRFHLSNQIQANTYISFSSALAASHLLPGVPHLIEAVSFQRSFARQVGHLTWTYHRFPKKLFFSYKKTDGFFMATPEKALLDLLHLYSLGQYDIDLKHINVETLSYPALLELAQPFSPRVKKLLKRLYRHA